MRPDAKLAAETFASADSRITELNAELKRVNAELVARQREMEDAEKVLAKCVDQDHPRRAFNVNGGKVIAVAWNLIGHESNGEDLRPQVDVDIYIPQ